MHSDHKFKALIIDDEHPSRLILQALAADHKDVIEIIAEAKNGKEALKLIDELYPDLIFLDINMPGLNGFELLSKIKHQPLIIFTTAYEEYAVKAFETNSVDYLLKPVDEKRFARSIQKLLRFGKSNGSLSLEQLREIFNKFSQNKKAGALPIKTGDKTILLKLEDVVYLEAKDKYVFVITSENKEHLTDTRLGEFEEMLPENFIRVQKSFIINKDCITEIHKYFGNRLIITMNDKNKSKIKTGITYINQIRETLGL